MKDLRIRKTAPKAVTRTEVLSSISVGDNYRYFSSETGKLSESKIKNVYAPDYTYSVFVN
jgi:hypothetical protein